LINPRDIINVTFYSHTHTDTHTQIDTTTHTHTQTHTQIDTTIHTHTHSRLTTCSRLTTKD